MAHCVIGTVVSLSWSWSSAGSWLWNHGWLVLGLLGQASFTARFVVQWLVSERKKDSVMPTAFWWLSLCGGVITLVYVIHLQSLPLALGQFMGLFVYVRNLMLVSKKKRRASRRANRADTTATDELPPVHHHHPHPHRLHRKDRAEATD